MRSTSRRFLRSLIPVVFIAAASCNDNNNGTGPNNNFTPLTSAERQALVNLSNNVAFQQAVFGMGSTTDTVAEDATFLAFVAEHLQNIGTMTVQGTAQGTYRVFGAQFVIAVKTSATETTNVVWTGIIGVNDLENPTDVIVAGVVREGGASGSVTVPSTPIGDLTTGTLAFASYAHLTGATTGIVYSANVPGGSGNVGISNATFSGTTSCDLPEDPSVTACSFSTNGSFSTTFDFTAVQVDGDATVTIPAVTVTVPAIQLRISVDDTGSI